MTEEKKKIIVTGGTEGIALELAKHKVKKPSFGSCWSVHSMLARIEFEE